MSDVHLGHVFTVRVCDLLLVLHRGRRRLRLLFFLLPKTARQRCEQAIILKASNAMVQTINLLLFLLFTVFAVRTGSHLIAGQNKHKLVIIIIIIIMCISKHSDSDSGCTQSIKRVAFRPSAILTRGSSPTRCPAVRLLERPRPSGCSHCRRGSLSQAGRSSDWSHPEAV